jgi:hypothetical protein
MRQPNALDRKVFRSFYIEHRQQLRAINVVVRQYFLSDEPAQRRAGISPPLMHPVVYQNAPRGDWHDVAVG